MQAALLEAFLRYPTDESQIAPTQLGNAIRRFEFYGQNRYQLDSQYLWYQLRASVPATLTREIDAARAGVDFFVSLFYLSGTLALASLGAMFSDVDRWPSLGALGVIASLAMMGAYRGAVLGTDGWAAGVRAMVDLGRTTLAMSMGLAIPDKLEDERRMWLAVGWLTVYPYDSETARMINEFRAAGKPPASGDSAGHRIARISFVALGPSSRRRWPDRSPEQPRGEEHCPRRLARLAASPPRRQGEVW